MSTLSPEVKAQIAAMEQSINEAEKFFKDLTTKNEYDDVTTRLEPEDRARYDLTILYTINSLYWMLKRSLGEDPQNHGVKGELDRIKERMGRLKEIQDRAKMPRVDKRVAERVVRHELNMPKTKRLKTVRDENWENERKEEQEGGS